ncbi:hypothetical protein B0T17DRAFT_461980, partial [Bombardia bombarda]
YMNLLNEDIQDAAERFVPSEEPQKLEPSQIGLTYWTGEEKELFFEALARIGSSDAAKIAARIKTKSEFEVAQYLELLHDGVPSDISAKVNPREPVAPADLPAAIELSQACCSALEQAADALSLRQDEAEDREEAGRWGRNSWLITTGDLRPAMELFVVPNWLLLSERVFMNASFPEYNWTSMSDDKPAIRATALEDLYSLVVSITSRIIAAAIYVGQNRDRAIRAEYPEAQGVVHKGDVKAAVLSLGLGLKRDRREFWARCPRRLRLDVRDD